MKDVDISGRWTITTNGAFHGSYPNKQLAMAGWTAVMQPRPKQSYHCILYDPEGQVVDDKNSPTTGGQHRK